MSDYQSVKIEAVDGGTIRLRVVERHADMTELARVVDRQGNVRRSVAKRLRNFAALLLVDHREQDNSFVEQLQFLVDVGAAPSLEAAAQRVIAEVAIEELKVVGEGTDGPLHSAAVTVTARSSLAFRSFRAGKRHDAAASLDGDIELF
jgi:hypothetical protein